jgi:UDP-3-O-[3-hydroxymyristoyl] N-acetylglucosamine deacetylase/3-hydroxyacyl-[acyl-carrier-protein] dehydratase
MEHVKVDSIGILNNIDLHFENECARHKLLDVVGDLALTGRYIKGRIIAKCPGHNANIEFAKLLAKQYKKEHAANAVPYFDPNAKPLLDINDIRKMLPHRPPFLLVDKIMEIGEEYCIGVKNVSMNEPFFTGHFPDEPVMPGVLIVEAMAQCGGVYVINSLPGEGYSTYFMKLDNIKFRKKVIPGDTLIFKLKLMGPIRRGIAHMKGYAFVGNNVVCEGEFMAQIVKTN